MQRSSTGGGDGPPPAAPLLACQDALSIEQFCYLPGQKQDKDGTDVTVGCFCL